MQWTHIDTDGLIMSWHNPWWLTCNTRELGIRNILQIERDSKARISVWIRRFHRPWYVQHTVSAHQQQRAQMDQARHKNNNGCHSRTTRLAACPSLTAKTRWAPHQVLPPHCRHSCRYHPPCLAASWRRSGSPLIRWAASQWSRSAVDALVQNTVEQFNLSKKGLHPHRETEQGERRTDVRCNRGQSFMNAGSTRMHFVSQW